MDLSKYLESMKNLPERFSNLAFWRGVRKLRDEIVSAFEYVDSWGTHIESLLPSGDFVASKLLKLPSNSYDANALQHDVFTLARDENQVNTVLDVLSINSAHFAIDLTLPENSALIGKVIDCIVVQYQSPNYPPIKTKYTLPQGFYSEVWTTSGELANSYVVDKCACIATVYNVNNSELDAYKNMTLKSVTVHYR